MNLKHQKHVVYKTISQFFYLYQSIRYNNKMREISREAFALRKHMLLRASALTELWVRLSSLYLLRLPNVSLILLPRKIHNDLHLHINFSPFASEVENFIIGSSKRHLGDHPLNFGTLSSSVVTCNESSPIKSYDACHRVRVKSYQRKRLPENDTFNVQ